MINSWFEFSQLFGIGISAGLTVGFLCLGIRFVCHSFKGWFSSATRIW